MMIQMWIIDHAALEDIDSSSRCVTEPPQKEAQRQRADRRDRSTRVAVALPACALRAVAAVTAVALVVPVTR
jgi:hypothetical protein